MFDVGEYGGFILIFSVVVEVFFGIFLLIVWIIKEYVFGDEINDVIVDICLLFLFKKKVFVMLLLVMKYLMIVLFIIFVLLLVIVVRYVFIGLVCLRVIE